MSVARHDPSPRHAPAVRGRHMHTFVEELGTLPAQDVAQVRALVDPGLWAEVERTHGLGWMPFERNLELTRAVARTLGPRRADDFFRDMLLRGFEAPLLKKLVDSVVRVFGADTGAFLDWVAKGFALMFRGVGEWEVIERAPGAATLQVTGLPQAAVGDAIWLGSVASSLSALYVVARVEGVTTVRDVDEVRGSVRFRMRWQQS